MPIFPSLGRTEAGGFSEVHIQSGQCTNTGFHSKIFAPKNLIDMIQKHMKVRVLKRLLKTGTDISAHTSRTKASNVVKPAMSGNNFKVSNKREQIVEGTENLFKFLFKFIYIYIH